MFDHSILRSPLGKALEDLKLTCLDLGARGGFVEDLRLLGPSIRAVGFEPDREECRRLNQAAERESGPWNSLEYIPRAIGSGDKDQDFYQYSRGGSCSLYPGDKEHASKYDRDTYFKDEITSKIDTYTLDEVAQEFNFKDAVFLKMDIQGGELDVLKNATKLIESSLMAVRLEAYFEPMYEKQPLFCDLHQYLTQQNYTLMGFQELHSWRLQSRIKPAFPAPGDIPYSRGQMIHGDFIYFQKVGSNPIVRLSVEEVIKTGFLFLTYGYVDWAEKCFSHPDCLKFLDMEPGELKTTLKSLSRLIRWHQRWKNFRRGLAKCKSWILRSLN